MERIYRWSVSDILHRRSGIEDILMLCAKEVYNPNDMLEVTLTIKAV